MRTKLFITLFFDKLRFILLFLLLVSTSYYLILTQVDKVVEMPVNMELPDVEIRGSTEGGSEDSDRIYQGLGNLGSRLKETADQETIIYTMTTQNLYTFSSPFYQVSFCIYGTEESFWERFQGHVDQGMVPDNNGREVLAGYNAASYYQLEVGDILNEKLEYEFGAEEETYIVSGILGEEDRYYGNGLYVLNEYLPKHLPTPENNMIMIYTSGKQDYQRLSDYMDEIEDEYEIGAYIDNYKEKSRQKKGPINALLMKSMISLLILQLVFVYMTKGMEKKAGLIKALGIPDHLVFKVSALGFGVLILCTTFFAFVFSVILLEIKRALLFRVLPIISVTIFAVLFLEIAVKYKRISPNAL